MAQIRSYETQQTQEDQQRPDGDQSGEGGGRQSGDENDGRPDTPAPFSPEISRLCTAVTDRYRAGEFSKPSAILLIHDILCREGADPEADAFVAAFASFIAILDGFERFRADAATRGARPPGEDEGGSQLGDGEAGHAHGPDPSDGGRPESAPPTKRPRSPASDDDQFSSRRRIDVSALPWVTLEEETPSFLSPDLRRTQHALENFARDLKLAKASLTNSPRCPQFPDTEWTSLLSGKAVDFDRVLSALYSVSFDEQRREKLGHLEIVAGPSSPARTVKTHSEWVIACDSAWEATVYVFPHRSAELAAYGKYIKQLFASFAPTRHSRVIQFDRAVRLRVAQRRDLLLTDHAAFADLSMLWLQNAGASGDNDPQSRRSSSGRRRDACRRWNDGQCPNASSSCTYAHICSKCRNTGHVANSCPSASEPVRGTNRK